MQRLLIYINNSRGPTPPSLLAQARSVFLRFNTQLAQLGLSLDQCVKISQSINGEYGELNGGEHVPTLQLHFRYQRAQD